ncbi:MAG: M20/M25/M40 family metallo-hydrolase [Chitinophagaceae bacterium]|nr:M20/M25/M40 family metallo-hydrolase [Chitinophagaceae bacterium]
MKNILILFSAICFAPAINAQRLSKDEKKIIDVINTQMPETLRLLEDFVNINAGTFNTEGVRKGGNLLKDEFDKMGFTTEWIKLPDSIKSAGHLVASRKGKKGKKLLLLAHLDTVFEPDMPSNPFRLLNDSTATGQGVVDDKGGDVVIVAALQALHSLGLLKNVTITTYLTGDEETGGQPAAVTRADVIEKAKLHDLALSFEAGTLNTVCTGRRGADTWNLYVYGIQAHSSGIFGEKAGYGSIYEATRIIDSFRKALSTEKYLTFNPGLIAGGTTLVDSTDNVRVYGKDNIIASKTIALGDVRFLGEKQRREVRVKMKSIVENGNLPGTRAEIVFSDAMPSMEPTEANQQLLAVLNKVNNDMGLGEVTGGDPMKRGAGDIAFIADYITSIDGLGPSGKGSHAPGETINLKELPVLIQRAAIFIYRLTR